MPSLRIACRWIEEDTDLQHRYARARADQAERNAEEIVTLADETNRPGITMEEIQVAKLRIEARKWVAAKLLPKKYGDKAGDVQVNTNVQNNMTVLSPEKMRELQQWHRESWERDR